MDAANIIDSDITAITNIDYDHCYILGDTIDKKCFEKAGISCPLVPLLLGSKMPQRVYEYAQTL
ncbi:hypothetical protein [Francisella tularensis]|uniref:hypothetical protein n=1 Tax=Francisella tularensis TaxID=263 RepID=UPI001681513D|nr:hypothetical protein [Francisella tularensis]MBD2809132.1 hypothetical protein [Francisella tularensis]